jgi:hypothetical protein
LSGFQGIKGTIRLARDPKSEWGERSLHNSTKPSDKTVHI